MIVKNRVGNWVLRVYTQKPGEGWVIASEQYYPTRSEMREGMKVWKILTRSSLSKIKIKQYRVTFTCDIMPLEESAVWYKDVR